jgi:starch synthase
MLHNIVFVTGEASPYAKSGGLGDVCGSLPVALAARGHRVMVVMPRYLNGTNDKNYANAFYTSKHIKIRCFGGEHEITIFHEYRDSVDWLVFPHLTVDGNKSLYLVFVGVVFLTILDCF